MATLVATVAQLEATATDDALELLDLLMTTELIGKARTEADKQTIKQHPKLAKASAILAVVAQALLDARDWGDEREVRVSEVWEAIEMRVPRAEVRAAVITGTGVLPPPEAVPEGDWRVELAKKTATVVGFVKMLTTSVLPRAGSRCWPR
jgi:hypothetical protein